MSCEACTKANSTFCPDLALASTKRRPSSLAQSAASSYDTSLALRFKDAAAEPRFEGLGLGFDLGGGGATAVDVGRVVDAVASAAGLLSSHRSTLLPTRIQVRCGSACSRTSANHVRAFMKPALLIKMCKRRAGADNVLFRDVTS